MVTVPYTQVLSASLEWSVISMLKHFVFVVIVLCASVTGIIEASGCFENSDLDQKGVEAQESSAQYEVTELLRAENNEATEAFKDNDEAHDEGGDENRVLDVCSDRDNEGTKDTRMTKEEEQSKEERSEVLHTCSALGHCLCALGFCFFAPLATSCCKFAKGKNPYSFTFYLANGFQFFWRGFQLRFLRAFGDFSSGLVSLLSAPVRDEDARYFTLKSSLTAIWVPCVAGEKPRTFLVTALVSRFVRTLALVATLLLYKIGFPEFLQKRTSLLFCAPETTWTSLGINPASICPTFHDCFQFCASDSDHCLNHRFRSCDENDSFFFVILSTVLAIFSILSLLSTYRLHQFCNYAKLFQVSRTALPCCSPNDVDRDNSSLRLCYPCCPFQPILHRSEIFNKIWSGNFDEFEALLKDAPFEALVRPNLQGKTSFHEAAELEDCRFLEQLLGKIPQKKLVVKAPDKAKEREAKRQQINQMDGADRTLEMVELGDGGEELEEQLNIIECEQTNKESDKAGNVDKNKAKQRALVDYYDEEEEEVNSYLSDKINIKDSHSRSPIFNACEKLNLPALKLLLDAGFDPDEEDREGERPIQVAMRKGEIDEDGYASENTTVFVMNLLRSSKRVMKRTQVVEENPDSGHLLISQAGTQIMMISDKNIDWDVVDFIKRSKFRESEKKAATNSYLKALDPVLDGLVDTLKKEANKKRDVDGDVLSVISKAVEEGNAEQLDLLLQAGISPETSDTSGVTPYQRAYQAKRDDLLAKLVDAGANYTIETIVEAMQGNMTKAVISMINAGASENTRESNGIRTLFHIAAENENWEVFTHLLDSVDPMERPEEVIRYRDYDSHAASPNCQSLLVHMEKSGQLHLLHRMSKKIEVDLDTIQHMVINHWDIDCLLRLENPSLPPQIQSFASEKFARPPMENYSSEEAQRLIQRLKTHNIQFCGEDHDYEIRWNQPLPTLNDLARQSFQQKIRYAWEEKSAYEARGPTNGVQVATDGEWIKRVRFAYGGTFEKWRSTAWNINDPYLGEGGVEQEQFLLEEGDQVVQVTTYTAGNYMNLCGLEVSTLFNQHRFWGKKSSSCKRSITTNTFLAYCSGEARQVTLTFHWGQTNPTVCS